jgi:hypothetical protein
VAAFFKPEFGVEALQLDLQKTGFKSKKTSLAAN